MQDHRKKLSKTNNNPFVNNIEEYETTTTTSSPNFKNFSNGIHTIEKAKTTDSDISQKIRIFCTKYSTVKTIFLELKYLIW